MVFLVAVVVMMNTLTIDAGISTKNTRDILSIFTVRIVDQYWPKASLPIIEQLDDHLNLSSHIAERRLLTRAS